MIGEPPDDESAESPDQPVTEPARGSAGHPTTQPSAEPAGRSPAGPASPADGSATDPVQASAGLGAALTGADWGTQGRIGGSRRRRRTISSPPARRRRRRQRRAGWIMILLGLFIVVVAGWIVVTGLLARSHLQAMRGELTALRSRITAGDVQGARTLATQLAGNARSAHSLTTGPAWATVAGIPGVGDPLVSVRGIASAADDLGKNAVPQLVSITQSLDPRTLRTAGDTFDVSRIDAATPGLDAAVASGRRAEARLTTLPGRTWLSAVDTGRTQVADSLAKLVGTLGSADDAAHVLPTLFGQSTPQRYFVGFVNEAEMRGIGGIAGAFGILQADHGKLTFTHFGSDTEFNDIHDSGVELGATFDAHYADWTPTETYINSTSTPNFPSTAQIWAGMWQKKSGQRVDGAISVDPTALSYLLAVTGPTSLPDGTVVSAQNFVRLTESEAYEKFTADANAARKEYLLDIARSANKKILGSVSNPTALVKAAARAASQRRILVWSADSRVESVLATETLGGVVPQTVAPYVGPVVQTGAAGKLEYYLTRTTSWVRTGCGPTRTVTVTMNWTNNAPADVPPYVQASNKLRAPNPGDSLIWMNYFGTNGGGLEKITVDGVPGSVTQSQEQGHPTYTTYIDLPRGRTTTVVLTLLEPAGVGSPVVLDQPGVHPQRITVVDDSCR